MNQTGEVFICADIFNSRTHFQQESLANARVTRHSSACMKAHREEI